MSLTLAAAIMAMLVALTLYSIGVWSERCQRRLQPWHLIFFWAGLVADTIGTELMRRIAGNGFDLSLHSLTGLIALLLMAGHALWATVTVLRQQPASLRTFHHVSTAVWLIWLVPFFSGALMNAGVVRA